MTALAEFFTGLGGLLKSSPDVGDVHVDKPLKPKKKPSGVTDAEWQAMGKIAKVDEAKQIVFGWASVVEKGGQAVTDRQGDQIEPAELESAVYDFMLHRRDAGEMHEQVVGIGKVVESLMVTAEKLDAMGLDEDALPFGWWVGVKLESSEMFAKAKSGEYPMFSIGGKCLREATDG